MNIQSLDIKTRADIHNFTKKILRKYQKGLRTGKLPMDIFIEKILTAKNTPAWLKENDYLKNDSEFRKSYTDYIKKIVLKYKELELVYKLQEKGKHIDYKDKKAGLKDQLLLKNTLKKNGYELTIPAKYLTEKEVSYMLDYIKTGSIPIGHERVYNYIKPND